MMTDLPARWHFNFTQDPYRPIFGWWLLTVGRYPAVKIEEGLLRPAMFELQVWIFFPVVFRLRCDAKR